MRPALLLLLVAALGCSASSGAVEPVEAGHEGGFFAPDEAGGGWPDAGHDAADGGGGLGAPCDPSAFNPSAAGCHFLGATCESYHTDGDAGVVCTSAAAGLPVEAGPPDYCGRCTVDCSTQPAIDECTHAGGHCVAWRSDMDPICEL